jgi:hypothetical protein
LNFGHGCVSLKDLLKAIERTRPAPVVLVGFFLVGEAFVVQMNLGAAVFFGERHFDICFGTGLVVGISSPGVGDLLAGLDLGKGAAHIMGRAIGRLHQGFVTPAFAAIDFSLGATHALRPPPLLHHFGFGKGVEYRAGLCLNDAGNIESENMF